MEPPFFTYGLIWQPQLNFFYASLQIISSSCRVPFCHNGFRLEVANTDAGRMWQIYHFFLPLPHKYLYSRIFVFIEREFVMQDSRYACQKYRSIFLRFFYIVYIWLPVIVVACLFLLSYFPFHPIFSFRSPPPLLLLFFRCCCFSFPFLFRHWTKIEAGSQGPEATGCSGTFDDQGPLSKAPDWRETKDQVIESWFIRCPKLNVGDFVITLTSRVVV